MCVCESAGGGDRDFAGNEVAAKTHFHGSLCFTKDSQEWREVRRPRHHFLRCLATTYLRHVAARDGFPGPRPPAV